MKKSETKLCYVSAVPLTLWTFYRGLIKRLNREYGQVALITSAQPELEKLRDELGVPTFAIDFPRRITPFRDLIAVFRLCQLLRREKFNIVHAHTPKGAFVGMVAAFLARVPNRINTIHGSLLPTSSGVRRKILWFTEWLTGKLATRTLVVSKSLKEYMIEEKLYAADKLQMLAAGSACGIDLSYFNTEGDFRTSGKEIREKFQIPEDAIVIGFVGRLVQDKGIEALVRAFEKLNGVIQNSYLLLAGEFETVRDGLDEETKRTIKNAPNIRYNPQFTYDILPFYAAIDIYILPSRREGFSITLLEAAAVGLPTITTTAIGCVDAVEDNITGLLVEVDNVEQIFGAMRRLAEESQLREKLGQQGKRRILQFYGSQTLIDEHNRFYESLPEPH